MTYDHPTPADAPRLAELAEDLNRARWVANSIEAVAPQYSVYGQITDALEQTVEVLLVALGREGERLDNGVVAVSQFLLYGATVTDALDLMVERGV